MILVFLLPTTTIVRKMFKFDFEIDDTLDDIAGLSFVEERPPLPEEQGLVEEPYQDIPLQHLVRHFFLNVDVH